MNTVFFSRHSNGPAIPVHVMQLDYNVIAYIQERMIGHTGDDKVNEKLYYAE